MLFWVLWTNSLDIKKSEGVFYPYHVSLCSTSPRQCWLTMNLHIVSTTLTIATLFSLANYEFFWQILKCNFWSRWHTWGHGINTRSCLSRNYRLFYYGTKLRIFFLSFYVWYLYDLDDCVGISSLRLIVSLSFLSPNLSPRVPSSIVQYSKLVFFL